MNSRSLPNWLPVMVRCSLCKKDKHNTDNKYICMYDNNDNIYNDHKHTVLYVCIILVSLLLGIFLSLYLSCYEGNSDNSVLIFFFAHVLNTIPLFSIVKGFFVNFCMVMLEFCRPFFCTHPSGAKLHLIAPDYPLSPVCRLDLQNEPCLASGMIC